MEIPKQIEEVLEKLEKAGFEAYIVGGCVRDEIMGKTAHDYDITTSAEPRETERVFSDCRVVETGIKHGTVTVLFKGMSVEITTFRIDGDYPDGRHPEKVSFSRNLKDDLARRDFTMNAIAYSPKRGIIDIFDAVYLSQSCRDNFALEAEGKPNLREKNPAHAPYVRISKLLAHYRPVSLSNLRVIGGRQAGSGVLLESIGEVSFGPLRFEAYEAMGGHVQGETVFVERQKRWVFPGDILVNLKGFTREQAAFNRLAPYLMTSVDTDAKLAGAEREAIMELLTPGDWTIFGAHSQPIQLTK